MEIREFWPYYRQYGSFVEPGRKFRMADNPSRTTPNLAADSGRVTGYTETIGFFLAAVS
jgi:hypothetical protein